MRTAIKKSQRSRPSLSPGLTNYKEVEAVCKKLRNEEISRGGAEALLVGAGLDAGQARSVAKFEHEQHYEKVMRGRRERVAPSLGLDLVGGKMNGAA